MKRPCKACGRAVRGRAIFLYNTPRGPVYVHRQCFAAYNDSGAEPCDCDAHVSARSSGGRRQQWPRSPRASRAAAKRAARHWPGHRRGQVLPGDYS